MPEYATGIVYVRWRDGEPRLVAGWKVLDGSPLIARACSVCGRPFGIGAAVCALVVGDSADRDGRWHAAPALVLHQGCLEESAPDSPTVGAEVIEWARPLRGNAPAELGEGVAVVAADVPERGRPFLAAAAPVASAAGPCAPDTVALTLAEKCPHCSALVPAGQQERHDYTQHGHDWATNTDAGLALGADYCRACRRARWMIDDPICERTTG